MEITWMGIFAICFNRDEIALSFDTVPFLLLNTLSQLNLLFWFAEYPPEDRAVQTCEILMINI